jgi:hypothetical protein
MFERKISQADVRKVLEDGEVIESYPDDTPFPSALFFHSVEGRPLHAVVGKNKRDRELFVVTAYEPDSTKWSDNYRERR